MKKILVLGFMLLSAIGFGQLSTVPMGVGTKLNVAFPIINTAIDQINVNTAAIADAVMLADSNKTSAKNYTTTKWTNDLIDEYINNATEGVIVADSNKTSAKNYATTKWVTDEIEGTTGIRTIKKTIGIYGEAGVDFNFSNDADQDAENKDLGSIIPASAEVTQVVVVCTETLAGSGSHAITFRVGNASAGEQFIASTSCDDANENLRSTSVLTDAVAMNWSATTKIWIGGDPDANWNTFTGGVWSVYITYNDYTGF